MVVAKINPKGQILVPKALRARMGLQPGRRVRLIEDEGSLRIVAIPDDPIEAARGCLRISESLTDELLGDRDAERRRDRERGAR